MSQKSIIYIGLTIGSILGGYLPAIFGSSLFSITSVLLSGAGGVLGIIIAYRLTN